MTYFINLLFVLNGTLGLVCVFIIGFTFNHHRNLNIYLGILLLGTSIRSILRGFLELTQQTEIISSFCEMDLFVIGIPLPYLYFKNLESNKSNFEPRDLLHFLLPILSLFQHTSHFFGDILQVELDYFNRYLIVFLCFYYFILSLAILKKVIWKKAALIEIETENSVLLKKWTIILFIATLVTGCKLAFSVMTLGYSDLSGDNYLLLMVWAAVFIYLLTSPSLLEVYVNQIQYLEPAQTKGKSFWQLKPIKQITNPKDIQLSVKINSELDEYFLHITQFVETEHFFRKSDVTLNDLAIKSKIPISHLTFIFKYHSEATFSDYRKVARIQDAVDLIQMGYLKTNSLDSLSKEVGFYTYNSFYTAFKEVTGNAPQKYVTALTT
jgi:AraC-like DNA-binding protein